MTCRKRAKYSLLMKNLDFISFFDGSIVENIHEKPSVE